MVFVIILCIGGAGWGGWRMGVWLLNKRMVEENTFLRNHIADLKETIRYYSDQSNYNREIQNKTIQDHNTNLNNTLQSIVKFLQTQNKEHMKEGEKEQVENIIKTIKGITQ